MNDDWLSLSEEERDRLLALEDGARPLPEILAELDDVRVRHVGDILSEGSFEGTAREALEEWLDNFSYLSPDEEPPLALLRRDGIYMMHLRTWLIEFEIDESD